VTVVALWMALSVAASNLGKLALSRFPFPLTISLVRFGLAAGLVGLGQFLASSRPPATLASTAARCWQWGLGLGLAGLTTNVASRMAVQHISVSFANTAKASQPLFSALLSWLVLRQVFSRATLYALAAVAAGVGLSAATEFRFSWLGFALAELSVLGNVAGSVFQKLLLGMSRGGGGSGGGSSGLDKQSLFFVTNAYSLLLLLPVWSLSDEPRALLALAHAGRFAPEVPSKSALPLEAASAGASAVAVLVLAALLAEAGQHFVSLTVLALVSPTSHAITSSCKRVVVIAASLLFWRNPVSALNGAGIALALGGVALYERTTRHPDKAAAGPGAASGGGQHLT